MARQGRLEGKAPYVLDHGDGSPSPSAEHLVLAARISDGLAADVWRSLRAIKRILNVLAVREHLARAGGAPPRPQTPDQNHRWSLMKDGG
jgi:hypothetical protein